MSGNPLRFFVFGGVILVLTGLLMLVVRPRDPAAAGLARYINRSTVWAAFCILVGVLAVLMGSGVVPVRLAPPGAG